MNPKKNESPSPAYLWFDTEFTSLDPTQAQLLQVALLVTDSSLRRLTGPEEDLNLCISLEPSAKISPWVEEHLTDLLDQCRSPAALSLAEVDNRLAALVDRAVGPVADDITARPILAGNTVHMDLLMARRFLPQFEGRLHYRLLDISTLKILWNNRHPDQPFNKDDPNVIATHLPNGISPPTGRAHDAYYDIHASLAEMNYYQQQLLV